MWLLWWPSASQSNIIPVSNSIHISLQTSVTSSTIFRYVCVCVCCVWEIYHPTSRKHHYRSWWDNLHQHRTCHFCCRCCHLTITKGTRKSLVVLYETDGGLTGWHYNDVIMTTIASQITNLTVVYSTVYSDADQRKHQSSASLAFVWGIHRWIPRTKGQLRGKCFHLITSSWN